MKYRYFVVAINPEDKPAIHQDLISKYGTEFIPSRSVVCDDPMRKSEYNGVYMLTEEEASQLYNDPRIADVHRDPEDLGILPKPFAVQAGNFVKPTAAATIPATDKNWGLARSISKVENFGSSYTATSFTYNLDGAGVDVVVLDTGILKYHPEFAVNADGTGGTRVQDPNWASYGAVGSNGTGSWVGDLDGHGSNVASIAAGNTNGWAKGANIYCMNIIDSTLTNYMSVIPALQTLRLWHNAKPVTSTGYKRPTVCVNSWGYEQVYSNMTATVWRGNTYASTVPSSAFGQVSSDGSTPALNSPTTTTFGLRFTAIEAEIQSCIDAGVVFVAAAGNQAMKVDVLGGQDYDNYWISGTGTKNYYHRGTTPGAYDGVICVGAVSHTLPEHKIQFSNTGPRVDVFAPGNGIMGAYINASYIYPAVPDPRSTVSTATITTFYLNKVSGTSQACPQVAGVVACLLQSRPWLKQWQAQQWVRENAATGTLDETYYGGTGYTQYAGLQGATNRQLYQPFNNPNAWSITSNS